MASRFELTILGTSSATPTSKRFPTAQLLNVSERLFLIDCGEGAQIQLRRYRVRFQRINQIFISHLHGDHYLGLMGLISSLHLLGRQKKLVIFHPKGLKEIIDIQLQITGTVLNYEIEWVELNTSEPAQIYEDSQVSVHTVILYHRIPCCGFIFREKEKPLSLIKEKLAEHDVPLAAYHQLKRGENVVLPDGRKIMFRDVTREREMPRSYAYCSDTRFDARVAEAVKHVDLLYHEATFLHELLDRAEKTAHTTALEAGKIAAMAQVGKLLIGHYSVRYTDLNPLREEAGSQFPNTHLAEEGMTIQIG
ncbi:MAG TPA: ribonuclease Z [Bacteroidia bacterium]|nr:ribonuclease Z [Bacteroidia bacterium]